MSDSEYTLGLKENVTKGLAKIVEQAEKLKAKFDSLTKSTDSGLLKSIIQAKLLEKAFVKVKDAILGIDSATANYQKKAMQTAGNLGPRFAYMSKDVIKWAMETSEKLGIPFEDLSKKVGEGLHLGLSQKDAETYAKLDVTLGSLGTTGENLKQHFKDIQSLRPGQSVATLLQGKSQKEIQQMAEDFAALGVNMNDIINMNAGVKGTAEIMKKLVNGGDVGNLNKNFEASVPAINKLQQVFGNLVDKIFSGGTGQAPLQKIIELLKDPETVNMLRSVFLAIESGILKAFTWINTTGTTISSIINGIGIAFTFVSDKLDKIKNAIIAPFVWIDKNGEKIIETIAVMATTLGVCTLAYSLLTVGISGTIATLTAFAASVWASITSIATMAATIITSAITAIGAWIASIWASVTALYAQSVAMIAAYWPILLIIAIVIAAGVIFWKFRDQIIGALTSAWNFIKEIIGKIGDYISSIDLSSTGKNLIEGLWNGIKDASKWLMDKLSGFGTDVMNKVKEIFGIHSPSKEFAIIGKYNVEGMNKGMEQEIKSSDYSTMKDDVTTGFTGVGENTTNTHNNAATINIQLSGDSSSDNIITSIREAFDQLGFQLG